MKKLFLGPRKLMKVLIQTARSYWGSDTATLGAALSYYTLFSLVPVLIIVMAIAGLVFGPDAVRGEVKTQIQSAIGSGTAEQVESMIVAASDRKRGTIATIIATFLLILGTTGVFNQIRRALNNLWEVKPKPSKGYIRYLRNRVLSFAMVVCIGFLLLVSLTLHALLAAFSDYLLRVFSDFSIYVLKAFDLILAFGLTVVMIGMIYKFMSDAIIKWRDIWIGAVFTAVLFTLGKYLIGLYLGRSSYNDTYGAAGSIVLVLVWVYYSSQILFFGAEFTQTIATIRGDKIVPEEYAVRNVKVEVEQGVDESGKHFKEKVTELKIEADNSNEKLTEKNEKLKPK